MLTTDELLLGRVKKTGEFLLKLWTLRFLDLWYAERMTLKAIIHPAEEGGFWAEVPALPGCVTQGETEDEVKSNLREAITGWLEAGVL